MSDKHSQNTIISYLLLLFYFFSGLISLSYEVLWVRMLSLQFGVSIFGVIITLVAFMAGLGLGSFVGQRSDLKIEKPVLWYGVIEGVIALYALIMPTLLHHSDVMMRVVGVQSSLSVWYAFQFVVIGLMLFFPAFLMGLSFPVILRAIKATPISLSQIYGINTLGAALGALLPLYLLPNFGWLTSIHVVAFVGLLLALSALLCAKHLVADYQTTCPVDINSTFVIEKKILFAYAGVGAAALMLEVAWTRLFGMVLLRTEYVLAIILAVFLVGLGVGSLLARQLKAERWFVLLPILASSFSIFSLWLLPPLSNWVEESHSMSFLASLFMQGGMLALLTFPVTLVFGAWLPLLTRRYSSTNIGAAKLYGANSLGASAGALLSGFVLTPLLGSSATVVVASFVLVILGLIMAKSLRSWPVIPVLGLLAYPVYAMPSVEKLLPQLYHDTQDVYSHEDAIAITNVVQKDNGQRLLLSDLQRMDASSDPTAVAVQKNQARLPLLIHSAPKNVLFLGLGTGISAAGSLPFPELQRTAVELSQGAISAATHWFDVVNDHIADHVNIIRDDARHFLMSSADHYDVIIGDLFHPDLVGRSALLSVDQFERAQEHLTTDGVFVQWIALNQFDINSLKIVLRSFQKVFPHTNIFVDAFRMALVGSVHSISSVALLNNLNSLPEPDRRLATGGEGPWTWLGRYWGHFPVAAGAEQREWAPLIEYKLPMARYNGELDLSKLLGYLLKNRPDVKQAASELQISTDNYDKFERAYAATELAQRSWLAMLLGKGQEGERLLKLAYQANPKDRWIGFAVADDVMASWDAGRIANVSEKKVLESILKIRPDHPQALKRLWHLEQRDGNLKAAQVYRDRLRAISPLDSEVAQLAQ